MTDTVDPSPAPDQAPEPEAPHLETLVPLRASLSPALEVSKRPSPLERVKHLWQYRELIGNLTRKELKVKYKNSVLGFLWSLLNPLMYLVVFSLVFNIISEVKVSYYGIFFLSGLLAWNLFSAGLSQGTSAITGNAQLVTKVWFPREALVVATVLAACVHFFLQSLVLIAALLAFRRTPDVSYIPVFVLAFVTLLVLCVALAVALSAINVYLRDTQHLLEVALLAWFWLSAIAYPFSLVYDRLTPSRSWIATLNPVLVIVVAFQRTLYNPDFSNPGEASTMPDLNMGWYVTHLAISLAAGAAILVFALWLFSRLEDNFAEEI